MKNLMTNKSLELLDGVFTAFGKILCLIFLVSLPMSSFSETIERRMDTIFGESQPYVDFFYVLKNSVMSDDKDMVASLIRYPLEVVIDRKVVKIKSKGEFINLYIKVINENVRLAVEKQELSDLFVNANGIRIGRGHIWYSGICLDKECESSLVKVIAINPNSTRN